MATFRGQRGITAPNTIFTTTAKLSPRQIANKAMTLGCKKLDRDDKRTRPRYHLRERLLICNTIAFAEQMLNQRTRRTNRRVLAAEDDDSHFFDDHAALTPSIDQEEDPNISYHHHHHEDTSPLRTSFDDISHDTTKVNEIREAHHPSDRIPTNHFHHQKYQKSQMSTSSPIIAQ